MSDDVPVFEIAGEETGAASFAAFRAAVADVFDVSPLDPDHTGPVAAAAAHLGTVMIGTFTGPATHFARSPALVARSGLDHILVQYYVHGSFEGVADEMPIHVEAGDICVFDLAATFETHSTAYSNHSLLLPRQSLLHDLDAPEQLHGLVIRASNPLAAMIADHLTSVVRRIAVLDRQQALVAAEATASLTATILVSEAKRLGARASAAISAPGIRRVNAFIDRNIDDPALDAERIVKSLGVSRAALYRLMAPFGGVGRHIRQRRLNGAALELARADTCRIGEVARRWGFTNDTSFSRAFRQRFGVAPRAAKAGAVSVAGLSEATPATEEQRFAQWMRTLRAPRST